MVNIPTELLRTLVFVVDQRSFTKAAQSLGVTQPAVSAQIKRLQFLLGYELLDKSAPGVSLTPRGEMVVAHARRMLSVNDQIAQLGGGQPTAQTVRVAMPGQRLRNRAKVAGILIPAKSPGMATRTVCDVGCPPPSCVIWSLIDSIRRACVTTISPRGVRLTPGALLSRSS